ncbi:hypothetical protein P389DRAFT_198530 [Cystobasidium minutum MCA 4210]|uniref:uncharacterized protein n=1 Tax=Cystobasidium minutum MCA 4210 TaxID=1397322 RepID=UPI0034CD9F11|eukprot:jgi/Rhomi1/198530/gm1.6744_g
MRKVPILIERIAVLIRKARIPEVDFSGVVSKESHLPNNCKFQAGDTVCGQITPVKHVTGNIGALATKIAVSTGWIIRKPDELTHEQAASLPNAFVSAYKLAKNIKAGSRVFVNGGSGGIGLMLLQILKKWKRADVTTTASDQSWHIVEAQQPDAMVNYRKVGSLVTHLQASNALFDYIIDLVGDASLLNESRKVLSRDGTFIAFGGGLSSSSIFHFLKWFFGTLARGLLPAWLGGCGCKFRFVAIHKESDTTGGLTMLEDFLRKGWVKPCIDSVYDFEDALSAYDRLSR